MKKILIYVLITGILIQLVSCQLFSEKIDSTPTEDLIIESTETQGFTNNISTQIVSTENLDFHFINIQGSIFVGSYFSGNYIQIDFTNQKITNYDFPSNCQMMQSDLKVICQQQEGMVMYDLITNNDIFFLQTDKIQSWSLTESEESLYYTYKGEEDGLTSLYVYEFQSSVFRLLGEFNLSEWLVLPSVSSDGRFLAGAKHDTATKAKWYIINTDSNSINQLVTSDKFWATYNVSWSPISNNILLGETNINPEVGSCPNRIINYDPITDKAKILTDAPAQKCYDEFGFHGGNIWSPNGSMVALILQQSTLCVITLASNTQKCNLLSNDIDKPIRNLTWSPNSDYIAYLTSEYELQIYSITNQTTTSIGYIPYSLNTNVLTWSYED